MHRLRRLTQDFMQKDMMHDIAWGTAPRYLREAELYNMEPVSAVALELCAANFAKIVAEFDDFDDFEPELFVRILEHEKFACPSDKLSVVAARFFSCCASTDEDGALLASLTSAERMPSVAPSVALFFLRAALRHGTAAASTDPHAKKKRKTGTAAAFTTVKSPADDDGLLGAEGSLCRRCIHAIGDNYGLVFAPPADGSPPASPVEEHVPCMYRDADSVELGSRVPLRKMNLPPLVVMEVLEQALAASEKLRALEKAKVDAAVALKASVRAQSLNVRRYLNTAYGYWNEDWLILKDHSSFSSSIASLKTNLDALDAIIR